MNNHPFHLVDYSPWPLTCLIGALTFVSGMVMMFHKYSYNLISVGSLLLILTMSQWRLCDISREGNISGLSYKCCC